MDRNENLKIMIRKYFEQEHSGVKAETEEVITTTTKTTTAAAICI
jgi:phosphoenolpyruvate synthase/pyruvate phosphate dikinase